MSSRLLFRPFSGAMVWAGGGVASGFSLPQVLSMAGFAVHSPALITTTCLVGSFAVLMPTGFARGVLSSVEEVVGTHGKQAIQQSLAEVGDSQFLTSTKDGTFLLEQMTLGSGWQGRVLRTLASPFLPSTAQMMVRIQQAVDESKQNVGRSNNGNATTATDGQVVAAAVGGFLEGFLQDKKDTITTIGSAAYGVVLLLALGVDYFYRRADETRQEWKEKKQARLQKKEEDQKQRRESLQSGFQRAKEMFGFSGKRSSNQDEEREKEEQDKPE